MIKQCKVAPIKKEQQILEYRWLLQRYEEVVAPRECQRPLCWGPKDKFKFLARLNFLSTPRIYAMSQKNLMIVPLIIFHFFRRSWFFIDSIYTNSGDQKNLMVLPFDQIKKGVNILQICH